jgi:RNA polymerase sigma-70 factor, ECF subfamily
LVTITTSLGKDARRCNESARRYTSSQRIPDSSYAQTVQAPSTARSLDDAALARSITAAGARVDSAAETELYRRLAPRVRLYGLRHLRDPHAAADLVQQVLMLTLERLRAGKLREPDKLTSFVLGTCRMAVLEMRRGAARRDRLLATYTDPEEPATTPADAALDPDRLAACMEALAERERTVLVLTFFADQGADAVAAELGFTPGNVRVIRHRALARLRGCMQAQRPPA